MNDDLYHEEELLDGEDGEFTLPETGPSLIESVEPVDPESYAAVLHDSFGEKYVNIDLLTQRGGAVTIRRILGAMDLEAKAETQFYLDGDLVGFDHVVNAGQSIYVVGKLAGGR